MIMRSIRIILAVTLTIASSLPAYAADLPHGFLGQWTIDGSGEASVGSRSYDEPGHHCIIKYITAKDDIAAIGTRVYIVTMTCNEEGISGPVREIWAVRKVDGKDVLVMADQIQPSIRVLYRR
jgi:hypothetical protein